MNDIKVKLKVSENSVGKKLSLNEALDFSGTLFIYGDTERWSRLGNQISRSGRIYIYTDYTTDENGNPVPGIKIGDGVTSVSNLPFTSGWKTPRENHFADNVRHITATERSYWNDSINTLKQQITGVMHYRGITTTPLTDGSRDTVVVINNANYTPKDGDVVIYQDISYAYGSGVWDEIGSAAPLKALAYKDSASAVYTPKGTVSKPTFVGAKATIAVSGTPSGTVSQPTFTGNKLMSSGDYTPSGDVSKPTFVGAKATIAVSGTPGGTVSQPTFTGNETKITVTGTPSGSVSVNQTNTTINQVSNVGSTPTMRTYIENGTLKFSFNPGSTPTLSDITIATKVSSATFTGNTLTSNGSTTPSGTVSQPTFTGDKLTSSGEYTPSGDVSKPTFSGETETITSK